MDLACLASKWNPLPHQILFMNDFNQWSVRDENNWATHLGPKMSVLCNARQHGKDELLMWALTMTAYYKPGSISCYAMPLQTQIISIIGRTKRFFNIAGDFIDRYNVQAKEFIFKNGSTVKLFGIDNYEAILGHTFDGMMAISELQSCSPGAYDKVEPALDEDAATVMVGTPRGRKNQMLQDMYTGIDEIKRAYKEDNVPYKENHTITINNKDYTFNEWLSLSNNEYHISRIGNQHTGLKSARRIRRRYLKMAGNYGEEAARIKTEQEYFISEEGGSEFAVYKKEMKFIREKGNIIDASKQNLPHPDYPIYTAWDLARKKGAHPFVCIPFQVLPNPYDKENPFQIIILDYKASNKDGLYSLIQDWVIPNGYNKGPAVIPHDWAAEQALVANPYKWFKDNNMPVLDLKMTAIEAGMSIVRQRLLSGNVYFDNKCDQVKPDNDRRETLIEAMEAHTYEWDDKKNQPIPWEDWTQDYVDAFRYVCVSTLEYNLIDPTTVQELPKKFEWDDDGKCYYTPQKKQTSQHKYIGVA